MPLIKILNPHVADLIAAGEVVLRPASVVKELLENAVDADADAITCEITAGGVQYICVTDNGCGIERDMCATAFLSHATSKISSETDLESISTLGFRGEALASIAAVAKVDLFTLAQGDIGTSLHIEGGRISEPEDAGCPRGTTIIVRDLFYNTPARRKFLKKDATEAGHVLGVVQRCAMSHPEISVRFIKDGREQFHTPGDGSLRSCLHALMGREFLDSLIEAGPEHGEYSVSGYVSKPAKSRGNRSMQFFFVNGRPVRSGTLTAALETAYKNAVMAGKYPACVLHVKCPPHLYDINVHPAKAEIRFSDERSLFDAVYFAVKAAIDSGDTPVQLDGLRPRPTVSLSDKGTAGKQIELSESFVPKEGFPSAGLNIKETTPMPYGVPAGDIAEVQRPAFTTSIPPADSEMETINVVREGVYSSYDHNTVGYPPARLGYDLTYIRENEGVSEPSPVKDWRFVGEAFGLYIIGVTSDSVIFVDKHAAHERIIFERLKKSGQRAMGQLLIKPVVVNLDGGTQAVLVSNADLLLTLGFEIEEFGAGALVVRGAPDGLDPEDIPPVLDELAEKLLQNKKAPETERFEALLYSVACRAAIKSGGRQTPAELSALLDEVMENPDIRYCPHGRPVVMEIKKSQIEKQFGRT